MNVRFFVLALVCIASLPVYSQEQPPRQPFIEVTGTAEVELEPNEIYLLIKLKEFEENRQKTTLEQLDNDFFKAVKEAGIDRSRVQLADAGSTLDKIRRRDKDSFREKSYQIKLTSAAELEKVLTKLEPVKVNTADITRLSHSDLEKTRLDLKVKALQAARSKAETLLKSIGGEIGKPLLVREWDSDPRPMDMMANVRMQAYDESAPAPVEFRKIRLQAQVTAQFEIK